MCNWGKSGCQTTLGIGSFIVSHISVRHTVGTPQALQDLKYDILTTDKKMTVKVRHMRGDSITGVRGGVKVITKIKDKNELEIY